MNDIPGTLDWRDLMDPQPPATDPPLKDRHDYRRAVVDLLGRGLLPRDVASILKLSIQGVRDLASEASTIDAAKLKRFAK